MGRITIVPILRACILGIGIGIGIGIGTVLLAGVALAHSPYLTPRGDWVPWKAPDGSHYSLALLWGDGIIAADPGRPVVLDSSGQVVALGPLVTDAFVYCRTPPTDCILILDLRHLEGGTPAAVTPDPSAFWGGRIPDFYPEQRGEVPYGFKPVSLTLSDHWVAWTIPYRRHPLAILWTALLIWLGLKGGGGAESAWRAAQRMTAFLPLKVLGFVAVWAGIVIATAILPLIGTFFSLLYGSLLNLRPHLVAFAVAFLVGLWRAVARIVAPPSDNAAGAAGATN